MQGRTGRDGTAHGLRVGDDPRRVEVAEALLQLVRSSPRALVPDPLVEDHGEQEREPVRPDELVRLGVRPDGHERAARNACPRDLPLWSVDNHSNDGPLPGGGACRWPVIACGGSSG